MFLRCILCMLASYMLFSVVFVVAQEGEDEDAKVIYRERSYYDFEDLILEGDLRHPDGSFIFRRDQTEFESALDLERSFIPELKSSTQDAR